MLSSRPGAGTFFKASRQSVADAPLRQKLENASARHLEHVTLAYNEFPAIESERDIARRIKEDAIGHLDELLAQLKEKLEAKGSQVFFAIDAAEARSYILKLAKRANAQLVVKGKSMTTEEIELNKALQKAGFEVVETDLGEYIVQLRHEPPSHIITPAIHLSKEDIGETFQKELSVPYTAEPTELTAIARERLRSKFLKADMGIVGVNFAVAETGTLVLVENEGNGRLSTTLPEICVAVMGIEKVIPKMEDLSHFLEILARTATGQKITTYTNFINGPRRAGEIDGPRELHLIVLDNGRSEMLSDPVLREALYCLRCGACLNVCPVYRHIGGHAYGSTYPGPIGSIVSPSLKGIGAQNHLPFASTLCGACKEICPVRIDIPRILLHQRWKAGQSEYPPKWPRPARRAREAARFFAQAALHPTLMRVAARFGALLLRPFAKDGFVRRMPPPFGAWTRYRDFPLPRTSPRPKNDPPKTETQ
jgi:L-lactate dehydrogenase complex protein LldF